MFVSGRCLPGGITPKFFIIVMHIIRLAPIVTTNLPDDSAKNGGDKDTMIAVVISKTFNKGAAGATS